MGFLTTAFFICYMVSAPVLGYLADRYSRRPIIVIGALLWSVATLMTAVTWDFVLCSSGILWLGWGSQLCSHRSPLHCDLFPEHKRGRMLSVFFMGIAPAPRWAI